MSKKVFFKIVVPNYNNIAYIKKCLDSLMQQTFKDFIVVVVDDLSTDKSDLFCEYYERRYPDKIKFIKLKEKGYAGAARNAGLDYNVYESQYTYFLDSDDWLCDENVLQNIYNAIVKQKYPDMLQCTIIRLNKNGAIKIKADISSIEEIVRQGAGPSRHCIKSKFSYCKFKEHRAKSNDVVWFLRLLDAIDFNKIGKVDIPTMYYNTLSITSCQNNKTVKSSPACLLADAQLISDLLEEDFKKPEVKQAIQKYIDHKKTYSYIKMIDIDDFFKHSVAISIDYKKYQVFQEIFKQSGFKTIPRYFQGSTIAGKTGPENCTIAHNTVIRYAKEHNWPYVVVFEDDAYPSIDCAQKLASYLSIVPDDANMILFGWSRHTAIAKKEKSKQTFNFPYNKLDKNTKFWGSHAYMLFNNSYDRYLNYFKVNSKATADDLIYNHIHDTYVVDYPFFIQYSQTSSMNNHIGYIFNGDHDSPPKNFNKIEEYKLKVFKPAATFLWSNGKKYSTNDDYAKALQSAQLSQRNTNVFLNTCQPLAANANVFKNAKNIFIGRECSVKNNKMGFHGYDDLVKYKDIIQEAYVIHNDCSVYKYDLSTNTQTKVHDIDTSEYVDMLPTDKKYNETTGFLAYFFIKQHFKPEDLVLVNFSIADARFEKTSKIHTIEFEKQYYISNGIARTNI